MSALIKIYQKLRSKLLGFKMDLAFILAELPQTAHLGIKGDFQHEFRN